MKYILPLFFSLLFITATQIITAQNPYTIPVVFHILYYNGVGNIADSQVVNEMTILNQDYNKLNPDTGDVIPQFKELIGNAEIQFELAKLDPNGKPTTGIDRIDTSLANVGGDTSKINQWNPAMYLNIWTVNQFLSEVVSNENYQPLSHIDSFPSLDGIVIINNYVGSNGSGSPIVSRALTHIIGHWLCLLHTWGMGYCGVACGDDSVSDTPITKGYAYCPPDTSQAKICDSTIVENYQNFMEYSYCSKMFTNGQTDRMHNCLNSSLAHRNNIWSVTNLIATGLLADTTGILQNAFPNLSVYPNPFESSVQLRGLPDGLFDFTVWDVTGRIIMDEENIIPAEGDATIHFSSSPSPGMYFLKLSSGENYRVVKLIKD